MQVFLVEDSAAIRERVAALFEATPNVELVGHAADADGAIRDILAGSPDVVLLDISLAAGSGFDGNGIVGGGVGGHGMATSGRPGSLPQRTIPRHCSRRGDGAALR